MKRTVEEIRQQRFIDLCFLIEEEGFEVLKDSQDYKILIRPLVWRDWQKNGGKLGYEGLSKRYAISYAEARTICSKLKNPVKVQQLKKC